MNFFETGVPPNEARDAVWSGEVEVDDDAVECVVIGLFYEE